MEVEEEAHDKSVVVGSAMSLDAEGTPNEEEEEDGWLSTGGRRGGDVDGWGEEPGIQTKCSKGKNWKGKGCESKTV